MPAFAIVTAFFRNAGHLDAGHVEAGDLSGDYLEGAFGRRALLERAKGS